MSRGTALFVGAALVGAFFGRSFLGGGSTEPDLEPLPVSRVVDDGLVDVEWARTTDLRDPFQPLVLPGADAVAGDDEADDGTVE